MVGGIVEKICFPTSMATATTATATAT